jgi:nucleotide-binding universal stress UspA family protein
VITIERILCPTDLSAESDKAFRYAVALARAYEAKLFICHCLEAPQLSDESGRQQIKQLFAETIKEHVPPDAVKTLDWEGIVLEGEPDLMVPREAAERRVDLIVMRSRRRPYAAALLGSTAEAICRTAPCPVLVTHPREREWVSGATGDITLKRVLVAHDFSDDSELALSLGLSIAQEYQSEVHLIHVLPAAVTEHSWMTAGTESAFHQAARRLQTAVPAEARLWCEVKQAVREGPPYREVLAYAEEQDIDLICMGGRGLGFGGRALFGSNVDRVLRQAPCPVLVARPLKPATPSSFQWPGSLSRGV